MACHAFMGPAAVHALADHPHAEQYPTTRLGLLQILVSATSPKRQLASVY